MYRPWALTAATCCRASSSQPGPHRAARPRGLVPGRRDRRAPTEPSTVKQSGHLRVGDGTRHKAVQHRSDPRSSTRRGERKHPDVSCASRNGTPRLTNADRDVSPAKNPEGEARRALTEWMVIVSIMPATAGAHRTRRNCRSDRARFLASCSARSKYAKGRDAGQRGASRSPGGRPCTALARRR